MTVQVTGRRIVAGVPIDDTGFAYAGEGRLAELLAQRISPVFSQPATGEWVFGLVSSAMTSGAYERGVGIFPVGNAGPPEHLHPTYDEDFTVLQGEFVFTVHGEERIARAGERLVVSKGTPHTFRCVARATEDRPEEKIGVVVVETRPAARTGAVIATLFGMAHEGLLTAAGQPKPLHAMVIASEYADDTRFTSPPPSIVLPLAKAIAPLARLLGYRATDARYLSESFWSAHVEQP